MWGLSARSFLITLISFLLLSVNASAFDNKVGNDLPNLAHFEKLYVPGHHGLTVPGTTNWVSGQSLINLIIRGPITITHLDGSPYGVLNASPDGQAVWQPASIYNSALRGTWVVVGSSLCFDYNSTQQFCYLYRSNGGGKLVGYHQGRANHIVLTNKTVTPPQYYYPSQPVRDCSIGYQTYCGPSLCQGGVCTRDYICRCEPSGLPKWNRY
jgi:hypothetical protein